MIILSVSFPSLTFLAMVSKLKAQHALALPYFRPEDLRFLRNLAKRNNRAWFQPR